MSKFPYHLPVRAGSGSLLPSQGFLLFGLEFSPGAQHHDFVLSCGMSGVDEMEEATLLTPARSREIPGASAGGSVAESESWLLGICIVL